VNSLILDADGVFLSERPYWNTALATALWRSGLSDRVGERWNTLADMAFGAAALQLVTKRRGCNSNWDLAAVLSRALRPRPVIEDVARSLESEDDRGAVNAMLVSAEGLSASGTDDSTDPLLTFGIDRRGQEYDAVVADFQCIFHGNVDLGWRFDREVLREALDATCNAFGACIDSGYELRVCTGRHREEIELPIRRLGLDRFLGSEQLTCADDVDLAERSTGQHPLGKPHWFSPACSVLGYERAVAVLEGAEMPDRPDARVYVGDAAADYRAVLATNRLGLPMRYVHVRSGASWKELERTIALDPICLAVVDHLGEVAPLLAGTQ
jgi:phosphoglycolate phosphatase-like HAD superfamily hydrolase